MDISVVLGTYNRARSLLTTLKSFLDLECPPDLRWELVVVDNNSNDATPYVVRDFADRCGFSVCYVSEPRQGRSAALNAGIAQADGDIIVFTDDDVILHPKWLVSLKQTFQRFDCAAVAGRVIPKWSHAKPDWLIMEGQFAVVHFEYGDETKEIQEPPLGANCAFRRQVFQKYGLFRLDLGVTGSKHTITCDDTEFGFRLIRGGEKIIYCPAAIVYHPVDPKRTTKKYFLSWYYYNGVSVTRTFGLPTEGIFYFGIPRGLFREFLTNVSRWIFTLDSNQRFQQKLQVCRSIGNIVEGYRISHRRVEEPQSDEQIVGSSISRG